MYELLFRMLFLYRPFVHLRLFVSLYYIYYSKNNEWKINRLWHNLKFKEKIIMCAIMLTIIVFLAVWYLLIFLSKDIILFDEWMLCIYIWYLIVLRFQRYRFHVVLRFFGMVNDHTSFGNTLFSWKVKLLILIIKIFC